MITDETKIANALIDAGINEKISVLEATAFLAHLPDSRDAEIELNGIAEQLTEKSGVWVTCSGCHELNEGVPTGPFSNHLQCHLGLGCRECGGIGAVWDNSDYSALSSVSVSGEEKRHNGNRPLPYDRDTLGRFVRDAWVRWAQIQPDPKPSWLAPYDEIAESDKEADRQIGEAVARWTLIGDAARSSFSATRDKATIAALLPVGTKRMICDELKKARSEFMISDFEIAERILVAFGVAPPLSADRKGD